MDIQIDNETLLILEELVDSGIDSRRDARGTLDDCEPAFLDAIQNIDKLIMDLRVIVEEQEQ